MMLLTLFSLNATEYPINVTLNGSQEAPPNGSAGTGTLVGNYNDTSNQLIYTVTFSGLSANVTAAHFHAPAPPGISAGVMIPAVGFPTGVTSGSFTDTITLTAGQEDTLKMGLIYFNIHTEAIPSGEIRGQVFLQDSSYVLPDIRCQDDTTVSNDAGLCSASVAFSAVDTTAKPTATIYYRIGNTAITSPHVFPVGTTTVVATALNAAGADTCSFTVTVNDTEPPVVTCPADITAPNDPGECGAVVSFAASATDNCSDVALAYSHASGSFFPVGTTTVEVIATDSSGNADTCSFDVTVNDVEPPVIDSFGTRPRVLWPPNHRMRNVTVDYTATDNCPGPITCVLTVTSNEPQNGPGGNNTVDWEILDEHHIRLRAERNGPGQGRVYTIGVECTDQHGNSSSADTFVVVPHDLRNRLIRILLGMGNGYAYGVGHGSGNPHGVMMHENEPERSSLVTVYPNPSNSYFNINIEPSLIPEKITVSLYDMSGRLIERKDQLQGKQTLQMGHKLINGIYIVEIKQGNESKMFKVVKQ